MNIPTGYAQVTLGFTGSPLPFGAAVTFGVETSAIDTPIELADIVAVELSDSGIVSQIPTGVDLSNIHVKLGPNSTGRSVDRPTGLNGSGGTAGYPGVCALVQKITDIGGRRGRGRMYWPCVPEASVAAGGALDGSFQAALITNLEEIRVGLEAASQPMVLLHSHVDDSPSPILALSVSSQTATQRRRNRR